ncbi:hypothetical protein ACJMK2_012347 [Sinanodonta woodiana]|uniref:Protein rogdi n=1 Tax=Sinanodonta woodiana TaxID=1069815 RepID=A0ABD3V7Y7_SINWO
MAEGSDEDEETILRKELEWLLEEQVHKELENIQHTLLECSRRFPFRMGLGEYGCLVKPQRILMSSPNNTNQIKCVVTLLGDSICDADISFKHKKGKDDHLFKTAIHPETQWKLQQIQDAGNHLHSAISALNKIDTTHQFKTAKEVQMIVDNLIHSLDLGKSCLCFPKRKSIEDLTGSIGHNSLQPPVPSDVVLSFYIHGSKLILALYHLHSVSNSTEISARYQVESNVQWLNEAVILFTLGMQQCQQLLDKIHVIKQNEHVL